MRLASAVLKTTAKRGWSAKSAEDYYGFNRWGAGHFSVDDSGCVRVHPLKDARSIRLMDVIEEAREQGLRPPMTIRVQDLLRNRVEEINQAFADAIAGEGYPGRYRGVFPIKVNQMREVVEEILDAGEPFDFGLEAGSKPELLIALAQLDRKGGLIVCNGYKDEDYIRLALLGRRIGKEVIIVVEQLSELETILRVSDEVSVAPKIGLRLRLSVPGQGKWAASTGDNAKFGLNAAEIEAALNRLSSADMTEALCLCHFHIGSQVPSILPLKRAVTEATRYYCEIRRRGFPLQFIDVGGGLGVDYDGSRTNFESSMNYSTREYARDVVAGIHSVCADAGTHPPDIISESGRSIVAAHSILVLEVTERVAPAPEPSALDNPRDGEAEPSAVVRELRDLLEKPEGYSLLERYHDALQKKDEAASLFSLGYLDLTSRGQVDTLFWAICRDIRAAVTRKEGYIPEELQDLREKLAEKYVCNFSIFQSLLDHWALGQLFPVAPLHRLNQKPTIDATLADITCDSDGKIDTFTDLEDVRRTLRLHPFHPGEPYYLGVFLVGAYQDIMGDLHNLFGRVNEVHVFLEDDEEDGFYVEESITGFSAEEVLNFIQYKPADLTRSMKKQIDRATRQDLVRPREGVQWLAFYNQLLKDKTYLNPPQKRPPQPPQSAATNATNTRRVAAQTS